MLDLHTLRRDAVSHGEAPNPIDQKRDTQGEYHDRPFTGARDWLRPPHEQLALDLGLFGSLEGRQVRVAEPALDGRGLDGFAADGTGLRIVGHAVARFL